MDEIILPTIINSIFITLYLNQFTNFVASSLFVQASYRVKRDKRAGTKNKIKLNRTLDELSYCIELVFNHYVCPQGDVGPCILKPVRQAPVKNPCKCNSGYKHPLYMETNAIVKANEFNRKYVKQAAPLLPRCDLVLNIDADLLGSTRAVIAAGVRPSIIHAVSWCKFAIRRMKAQRLGNVNVPSSMRDYYTIVDMFGKNVVVCHDGMQAGSTTLIDLEHLFRANPRTIGLFVNIAKRGRNCSHLSFAYDVIKLAKHYGYKKINHRTKLREYTQNVTRICSYRFVFSK